MAARNTITKLAFLLFASPLLAQQNYITPLKPPSTPECAAQIKALDGIVQALRPLPEKWNWVVVCDQKSWGIITKDLPQRLQLAYGITDNKVSYTFIKGWLLLDPPPDVEPEFIVAHELGHIMTNGGDCKAADKFAFEIGHARFKHFH